MAYEQRDNSGTFFENDRKEQDTHPDYTGKAMVNGVMYWASLWIKNGSKGEFFSFSLKPMDNQRAPPARQQASSPQSQSRRFSPPAQRQQSAPAPAPRPRTGFDDMDSDIPF